MAERAKGEETVAPLAGVFTVMPAVEVLVVDCLATVMATSVSQAVPLPQDFTCKV